jgi:hypothetical protein
MLNRADRYARGPDVKPLARGRNCLFRRQIEPGARRSILDFNDPKVRIKPDFAFEPLVRLVGSDGFHLMRPGKNPLDAGLCLGCHRLWGGTI